MLVSLDLREAATVLCLVSPMIIDKSSQPGFQAVLGTDNLQSPVQCQLLIRYMNQTRLQVQSVFPSR